MRDVVVLCYHALSDEWPADLSVTPGRFAAQIELLAKRGYRGLTFSEAVSGPHPGRVAAVTFDDAYTSVIERARPILDRLGFRATVFVPTAFPDSGKPLSWSGIDQWLGGAHEAELTAMSWDQLAGLQRAGWEIGSHTHTHPRLTELDDETLELELRRSRECIDQRLAGPCRSIAYPYGDFDERVAAASGRAGYSYGATLTAWLPTKGPLRWPRVGVYHTDAQWRFRAKLSIGVRRVASTRAANSVITRIRGR